MIRQLLANAVAFAFLTGVVHGSGVNSPAQVGKQLYNSNCARCHGFQMMNPAPGVFDLQTIPMDGKVRFVTAVSEGKNAMPAWKSVLSADEIEALWSYVSTARTP